jgi:hypothetical protein
MQFKVGTQVLYKKIGPEWANIIIHVEPGQVGIIKGVTDFRGEILYAVYWGSGSVSHGICAGGEGKNLVPYGCGCWTTEKNIIPYIQVEVLR